MSKVKALQLRTKRAEVIHQMRDIVATAEKENRNLNDEENQKFNGWEKEEADLKGQIERLERLANLEAELAEQEYTTRQQGVQIDQRAAETARAAILRKLGSNEQLTADEINQRAKMEMQSFGKFLRSQGLSADDLKLLKRAQAVGTDSAGGFLVPETLANELIVKMKAYNGILEVARVERSATGATLNIAGYDETSREGELVAENATMTAQDVTFSNLALGAYKFGSKIILVSVELMQDSAFSVENLVSDVSSERLGRVTSRLMTVGTGSGQPQGIVTGAGAGITAAATAAITRDEILDLKHSVNSAYRNSPNVRFMFNDNTLRDIKKLTNGTGDARPLWQPSIREGEPDRIEGHAYVINDNMADIGAGNVPMIFGDMSKFMVRIVRDVSLFRFNEKYMNAGQIGFVAWMRADSKVLDNSAIKKLTNAAT